MKKLIFSFFFLIGSLSYTFAQENIVFLNVNYIYTNSASGKEANKSIEKKLRALKKI